jgi:ribulose-5-phosphate 4-epimerase/fuculose-1-phosphate aldolase
MAIAVQGDLVGGHVGVRDPDGGCVWIKAPGWGFEEVDDGRVQLVSWDAVVLEGEGAPYKESHIHLESCMLSPHSSAR